MKDISQLMRQAQQMQAKLNEAQKKLEAMEVEGSSGGGMVRVTINGKGMAKSVHIDPSLIDPKDKGMLEDLVLAAMNDARAKVDARMGEEMSKMTGGLPLPPGMKF